MSLSEVFISNAIVLGGLFFLLWLIGLWRRDVSLVDIFWGLSFVVVAWSTAWHRETISPRSWLLVTLVTLWGSRLAAYLLWRNWGQPEDYRYRSMREQHGTRFPLVSLFTVFLLQGFLVWVISLPIQVGIARCPTWPMAAVVGSFLWVLGFTFESVGDYQLAKFKANSKNQGQVMNRGLWRYTRHPNYFGDFLVWWGLYVTSMTSHTWWWTALSPIVMSFLLIRVSGVRLLESSLRQRKAGYAEYVRRTSAFFPLPPRPSSAEAEA